MTLTVPRDGSTFARIVVDRCEHLIHSQIWEGIGLESFRAWLQNFDGPEEEYFSACILDSLVYRSNRQTVALMKQLFQRSLPDLLWRCPPRTTSTRFSWYDRLKQNDWNDPQVRVIPIINSHHPPTKSGPLIARMYCRNLGLNSGWFIWPWQLSEHYKQGVRKFLLIDDFLGTGDQVEHFIENMPALNTMSDAYFVYAPLTAHQSGIAKLRQLAPWLHCCFAELLDPSNGIFSPDSKCFDDGTNTVTGCTDFYEAFFRHKRLDRYHPITRALGHGHMSLAYAFQHATPDNCLPLLWLKTPEWRPLLPR